MESEYCRSQMSQIQKGGMNSFIGGIERERVSSYKKIQFRKLSYQNYHSASIQAPISHILEIGARLKTEWKSSYLLFSKCLQPSQVYRHVYTSQSTIYTWFDLDRYFRTCVLKKRLFKNCHVIFFPKLFVT